jgi:hypothetical protein
MRFFHSSTLQSSTLVAPYITEHKKIVHSQHPTQSDSWITHKHMATFGSLLRTHLINNNIVGDQLCGDPGLPPRIPVMHTIHDPRKTVVYPHNRVGISDYIIHYIASS